MLKISKNAIGFMLPFAIFVLVGGLHLALNYSNGYWVLYFCENFNQNFYDLFSWFTLLGEPQVLVPIALLMFAFNYGRGAFVFSAWFIASLITIILKGIIANHRPAYYYEDIFIACAGEVKMWFHLSTPSGHTTAAFAFFASLAILSKSKILQFIFFIIALGAGLSRMVLFMHFYYDVYFGAIIGTLSAVIILHFLESNPRFGFEKWRNKSIIGRKQ